jgi:hypothetical protein
VPDGRHDRPFGPGETFAGNLSRQPMADRTVLTCELGRGCIDRQATGIGDIISGGEKLDPSVVRRHDAVGIPNELIIRTPGITHDNAGPALIHNRHTLRKFSDVRLILSLPMKISRRSHEWPWRT